MAGTMPLHCGFRRIILSMKHEKKDDEAAKVMSNQEAFKPVPFYFINTTRKEELSLPAARDAMRRLKDAGYGGLIFFNKPPDGFSREEYLSDYWFEVTENFIVAAREEHLEFWINDGYNFPPGDVAGRIEAVNPALKQRRLKRFPDGHIEAVEVEWGFPAFEEPESSRLFIELLYEEYRRRLGKYFGNGITGFFSDADNRRVNHFTLPQLNGEIYYPWSRDFGREFRKRFGYEIEPHLSELFDGTSPELNQHYWQMAGELYQRWFRSNYEWCGKHGLKYSFHTSDTGPFSLKECPRSSLFWEGEPLKLLMYSDFPGTDHELAALDGGTHYDGRFFFPEAFLGGDTEKLCNSNFSDTRFDLRAKYAASAAFLYGKKRVLCEAFAATGWGADPALLRRIAAWQIMQGVNFFVPHAVHHRFFGETKYFAPPEFLHGSLRHGICEFNDFLSRFSFIAAQGEYVAPVGVIDPSPEILAGRADGKPLFELCNRLNRQSLGYVITDREHASQFPILMDPLAEDMPELPEADASFDGGELAWMKRRLADGTEYMLAANIWSDRTLSGHLSFNGRDIELELVPGEIAVIGGPYESWRSPSQCGREQNLKMTRAPRRETDNLIPMHTLRAWENRDSLPGMRLLVPECLLGKVRCDGKKLVNGTPCHVFDDVYQSFSVPAEAGRHTLSFDSEPCFTVPVLLVGDFHVRLAGMNSPRKKLYEYYQLTVTAPEAMSAELYPPEPLRIGKWTEQGLPFYSGCISYEFSIEGEFPSAELELKTSGICEVLLDGSFAGRLLWQPYRLPLGDLSGSHRLVVRLWNSAANRLDGYCAPGGLLELPRLHCK